MSERPAKRSSFVGTSSESGSPIKSSNSDHGRSNSQLASNRVSSGISKDSFDPNASPSANIKRRFHSMNDLVRQFGPNGLPLSSSLGSVSAAAANREAAPPVDPNALVDMINRTQALSDSLTGAIEKIAVQLRTMAKLTVENLNVMDETASSSCESAEQLVKALYSLMSKYDEMRKELYIIPTVSQQLKEIERLLDVLEMHVSNAERSR